MSCKGKRYAAETITGKVLSVDPAAQTATIQLDHPTQLSSAEIAQRVAHFNNAFHDSVHPLASADLQGNTLTLKTQDALLVGRLRLTGGDKNKLTTDTVLPFSQTYNGTTLLNGSYQPISQVKNVDSGGQNWWFHPVDRHTRNNRVRRLSPGDIRCLLRR